MARKSGIIYRNLINYNGQTPRFTTCDRLVSDGTFFSIDTTLRAWEPFAL